MFCGDQHAVRWHGAPAHPPKTLYRLTPATTDLFTSVASDRIERFMFEVDEEVIVAHDLPAALERLLVAYRELALDQIAATLCEVLQFSDDREHPIRPVHLMSPTKLASGVFATPQISQLLALKDLSRRHKDFL